MALKLVRQVRFKYVVAEVLVTLVGTMIVKESTVLGTILLGATIALLETQGVVLQPGSQPDFDRYLLSAQTQLGQSLFEKYIMESRRMTFDEAMEYALSN
ncbi:MAG: hypothetical protein AAB571_05315 [Chloroflexota bacterium]